MEEFLHENDIEDAKDWKANPGKYILVTEENEMMYNLILEVTQLRKELERLHSIIDKP